jgi:NitT/TauT family transport system permease protein
VKTLTSIPGVPPLIACFCLLLAWEGIARFVGLDSLPTAWESLKELPAILKDPRSLYDILSSVRRMVTGFALALCFAVPVGLMMGRSQKVAAFFNPLFMMIYPVPKAALMPIIMLWLGIGEASKTLVIFLGVSLPVIYHTYQGAKAVGEKLLWSGAAMGMSKREQMLRIVLPAAMPEIMVGCRTGLVLALITMVTSEMIVRQAGIGNLLFNSLDLAQYATTYATIVIVGFLGFVVDLAFEKARGVVVGWADPVHQIAVGSA